MAHWFGEFKKETKLDLSVGKSIVCTCYSWNPTSDQLFFEGKGVAIPIELIMVG